MDFRILVVLIVFMGLFMGGGVLIIKGALNRKYKQLTIGIGLIVLCIVFMMIVKNMKGLY